MGGERFYEAPVGADQRRSAPAALRNRGPIADVLREWLPDKGLVLEVASGTGEHIVHFAERFPSLEWQPSDVHPDALASIEGWSKAAPLPNLEPPVLLDASAGHWPLDRADAVLSINMVHISPWATALGLLAGAARVLPAGGSLVLYGPWIIGDVPPARSNLEFDSELKRRNPLWGLRKVEDFARSAEPDFQLVETRPMPANNLMLFLRRR
jgi:SAM-dependent methyltransferase